MDLTLDQLKKAYPELVKDIETSAEQKGFAEGKQKGYEEGIAAGSKAERERIQTVEAQALPGHEKLISELKYDGITTGPEAAVQVLAAEKSLITTKHKDLTVEKTVVVPIAEPKNPPSADTSKEDETLPFEERIKAHWDKHPETRAEFAGDYESYKAYKEAEDKGLVKIYKGKGGN